MLKSTACACVWLGFLGWQKQFNLSKFTVVCLLVTDGDGVLVMQCRRKVSVAAGGLH